MTRFAHPEAMAPRKRGATRTAPPEIPETFWSQPRMRTYLLFDATGIVYLLAAGVALRVAWALGAGPTAWAELLRSLAHPLYLGLHLLALLSALFVGVRFFRLFPKAQPARLGPLAPPPRAVLHGGLYALWLAITALWVAVLGGLWP